MDKPNWLAQAASLVDRLRRKARPTPDPHSDPDIVSPRDPQADRRRASRALATRLPAHLRRDIGADDG